MSVGISLIIIFILCILSIYDIFYKEIPVIGIIVGGSIGIAYNFYLHTDYVYIMWAITPGMVFLAASLASKKIGAGDGMCIIVSELSIPVYLVVDELMIMAVCSLLVAFLYKIKKQSDVSIPFVPVITLSHILTMLMGELE